MNNDIFTSILKHVEDNMLNIVPLVASGKPSSKMYFEYHMAYEVTEQLNKHDMETQDRRMIFDKVMLSILEIAKKKGVIA